ncbi:hypothetical protein DNHGIG_19160 [Collibacillus ludicampi]|uniref:Uncharacterized protein n=1 Tax=Collibacillus ludicampi TaxID=2771369 RepID=A0AAV4LEY4_9BACL|nr:hypothetical protein [Collibacillus ludicampi]GIM46367.1 hypothetical protein DNHGIG_19160 [Collibacillus ludicampi]
MNATEAVDYYEKQICDWCSFRQAGLFLECVSCPIEQWKQKIIAEHMKLAIRVRKQNRIDGKREEPIDVDRRSE